MNSKKPLPQLASLKRVHIIGVCGTLMGAFAAFLKRQGVHVTGSDQNVYPPMSDVLKDAGVELFQGYRAENLTDLAQPPDLVVIGNVISRSNPESQKAIEGGFAYASLPEAMEALFLQKTRNLVVAGTHGKTTTSSLLSYVLVSCGKDPSYFMGGVSADLPFSFNVASIEAGRYFVLEGDEYDTAFWDKVPKFNHYLPDDVILTSVEYDHADIYPDFASVIRAFEGLLVRMRDTKGRLIACWDYEVVQKLCAQARCEVLSYGSDEKTGARFFAQNIREENGQTKFEITDRKKDGARVAQVALQIPGRHNILNAMAVWIECQGLGMDSDQVLGALASFRGVKRRQELRGEVRGVMVIDDFAHHPTAVRETLRALKARYPERRLVAVFEPRSATSRRKIFQKDYVEAFGSADQVFISSPYDQTKISESDQFSSAELVDDLRAKRVAAELMATVEEGVFAVSRQGRPGDLIAVLSNGGFGGFIPKLLGALRGGC
ncbi:Mur ligase family protein [Bdellovibrionota bacterium FG-2]